MSMAVPHNKAVKVSSARQSSQKEAKALSIELADLLTKRDPWHQDVVFARENLRRHCLALIFNVGQPNDSATRPTSARHRMHGLNLLFLHTSHNIIHVYRQRLAALDKPNSSAAIKAASGTAREGAANRDHRSDDGSTDSRRTSVGGNQAAAGTGPAVQKRKLLQSFRDFLVKDEAFWIGLLVRIIGVFDVEEARSCLRVLQVGQGDWELDHALPRDKDTHDQGILLCHKALICYGDLARYRELYAEPSVLPVPNNAPSPSRPRGGKLAPRTSANAKTYTPKDYSRAATAYHQARLLFPDDGNPSNQLAVLAGYNDDLLSTIYHYYRALCVKKPFVTAKANLTASLKKALTSWNNAQRNDTPTSASRFANGAYGSNDVANDVAGPKSPVNRHQQDQQVAGLKVQFLGLHATLHLGQSYVELPGLFAKVSKAFRLAVQGRLVPSDMIVKFVVTSLEAWWTARMYRHTSQRTRSRRNRHDKVAQIDHTAFESSALMHALAMAAELLDITIVEVRNVDPQAILRNTKGLTASEKPMALAQAITAVLRRILPALRIVSMWLLASAEYLSKYDVTSAAYREADAGVPAEVCTAVKSFWLAYASFATALQRAFPTSNLPTPPTGLLLEEDVDMLGFAPLRRRVRGATSNSLSMDNTTQTLSAAKTITSDLHPNEEQILRIGDLLSDAQLLSQSEVCPVMSKAGTFAVRDKRLNPASAAWTPASAGFQRSLARPQSVTPPMSEDSSDEDADEAINMSTSALAGNNRGAASVHSEYAGDDDVIELAMRVATGAQEGLSLQGAGHSDDLDDEDDDRVLYPSYGFESTIVQATRSPIPAAAVLPIQPPVPEQRTLNNRFEPAGLASRTASDLLIQVLSGNPAERSSPLLQDAVLPQYGAAPAYSSMQTLPHASTVSHSIWSSMPTAPKPLSGRTGSPGPVAAADVSAEALFNSMPNQNQGKGQQSSPRLGSSARLPATPAATFGAIGSGPSNRQANSPKRPTPMSSPYISTTSISPRPGPG